MTELTAMTAMEIARITKHAVIIFLCPGVIALHLPSWHRLSFYQSP